MLGAHHTAQNVSDVIVTGGGPVGLCMALQLASYGIRSVLIETAPETRWHPKGNTNNARTMEIFRRMGIADSVRELGIPADHPFDVAFFTRYSTFEIARGYTPSRRERLARRDIAQPTHQVVEPPHRANQNVLRTAAVRPRSCFATRHIEIWLYRGDLLPRTGME